MTSHFNNPKSSLNIKLKNIFKGMITLGGGKEEGIQFFPFTSEGVLNSLAPWIAVVVVCGGLNILNGYLHHKPYLISFGISFFLCFLCYYLVIPIIIQSFATYFKKEEFWKRTVSAFCWCQWLPLFDLIFGVIVISLLGFSPSVIVSFLSILFILYIAYILWIAWFTVKIGLQASNKQSIFVVATIVLIQHLFTFLLLILNNETIIKLSQDLAVAQ